ncbi:hypothetical protein DFH11DRAFT_1608370 [Phellopilus nigrolimitatus]|nr:hypothetical protein DFH11DRAFT_1608370 [Phellopilus nigrolimitatus]
MTSTNIDWSSGTPRQPPPYAKPPRRLLRYRELGCPCGTTARAPADQRRRNYACVLCSPPLFLPILSVSKSASNEDMLRPCGNLSVRSFAIEGALDQAVVHRMDGLLRKQRVDGLDRARRLTQQFSSYRIHKSASRRRPGWRHAARSPSSSPVALFIHIRFVPFACETMFLDRSDSSPIAAPTLVLLIIV